MIKLGFRLIVFIVIIVSFCYATLHIYPNYKKEYVAGSIPKLNKLKKVKNKKIIVIGGSNAAFGIDSDLMERELGIPVVNMALHAALPLSYVFEQVRPFVNKGDILILSREYDGLVGDHRWAHMVGTEIPKIVTYDVSGFMSLLSSQTFFQTTILSILETIKLYIKTYPITASVNTTSVYSSYAFKNDNLFDSFLQGSFEETVENNPLPKPAISSQIVNGLTEYKEYFDNQGVDLYLTPPLIVEGFYKKEDIASFWEFMTESTKIPMLNSEKTYTYPKEYFLNSYYHSNAIGRKKRTISIMSDIIENQSIGLNTRTVNHIYVSNYKKHSLADLSDFNSVHNFKIIHRDSNEIHAAQTGDLDHNYFRMEFQDVDYRGYSFYIQLEADNTVVEEIKFRGTGELLSFDSIVSLGDNNYGLWKRMNKVLWTDNNSYFGISFPNNPIIKDAKFKVKNVGLYKDLSESDSLVDNYKVSSSKGRPLLFEVLSKNHIVKLDEISNATIVRTNVELRANQLYKIDYSENGIIVKDFYTGKMVFKTKNEISFIISSDNLVNIYEY